MYKFRNLVLILSLSLLLTGSQANAGLLGSLDKELTSLIKKTEPYLVTVKGEGSWRNLIATGVVYDADGHVLTSSPAFLASDFEVTFSSGETYKAEAAGVDHETGLAVLKIEGDRKFQTPEWGASSSLKKGDWVLFVGNSYDRQSSVNIGTYGETDEEGLLELNLNVDPGSSGGAILNTDGEVIGILVAKESGSPAALYWHDMNLGDYQVLRRDKRPGNTALALSIDKAKEIAGQLVEHGKIKRGFLGISQENLSDELKEKNDVDAGVVITDIVEDSPADEAGLREDDIITRIDGEEIDGTGDLYNRVRSHKPGDRITITYLRDGKSGDVEVELSESKSDYFLGSLNTDFLLPKLKVNNKLKLPDGDALELQMEQLRDELDRLRLEMEGLKKDLRK